MAHQLWCVDRILAVWQQAAELCGRIFCHRVCNFFGWAGMCIRPDRTEDTFRWSGLEMIQGLVVQSGKWPNARPAMHLACQGFCFGKSNDVHTLLCSSHWILLSHRQEWRSQAQRYPWLTVSISRPNSSQLRGHRRCPNFLSLRSTALDTALLFSIPRASF